MSRFRRSARWHPTAPPPGNTTPPADHISAPGQDAPNLTGKSHRPWPGWRQRTCWSSVVWLVAGAGQAAWARVTVNPSAPSCRTWLRAFVFAGAAGVIADAEFAMAGGAAGESGSDVSSKWPAGQTVAKIIEIWPRSLRPYNMCRVSQRMTCRSCATWAFPVVSRR